MEIQVLEQDAIALAFQKKGGTNELFEAIAKEARSHVPDVTTKKGRDAIGSLAMKISKSKTLIESCGKGLVAEQKAQIKLIDNDRIEIVKKFDELRSEILAPRDAWEQQQAEINRLISEKVDHVKSFVLLTGEYASTDIQKLIDDLTAIEINDSFGERQDEAELAKYKGLEVLKAQYAIESKREADQAEAERLAEIERKENERLQKIEDDRIQKERDEKIAREASEKARIEAEAKALVEAQKKEKENKLAIENAEREKQQALEREQQSKRDAEQAKLREQQLKQKAIDDAKQAEIDKQNAINAERERLEREAEAERQAEAKRAADKDHKKNVCDSILAELAKLNIDEKTGQALIKAIYTNQIPNITIKF